MGLKVACQPSLMAYRSHRALCPNTFLDNGARHLKGCAHPEYPNRNRSNPAFAGSHLRHQNFDPSKCRDGTDRHFGDVGYRV